MISWIFTQCTVANAMYAITFWNMQAENMQHKRYFYTVWLFQILKKHKVGKQEFVRLTLTVTESDHVIKPQTLNPHVKVVCAFSSKLKTVDRCEVISAKIFLDERGASCHFSFKWLHQLQHLRIHISAGRRRHCWEFEYDNTWIIQRKLILVKSSHGVQTAQGNEELYFQMVNTKFEKKKRKKKKTLIVIRWRRHSLFEHFFTLVLFKNILLSI